MTIVNKDLKESIYVFEISGKHILKVVINWDCKTAMVLDEDDNILKRII